MANDNNTEHFHIDALFTVAEDIGRFAPWDDGYAPFVLISPEHPDAMVLVVIESGDEGTSDIRLFLGRDGMRIWMLEQDNEEDDNDDERLFSAERFVNRYEGYYLEVGYNTPFLNNYEKRQLEDRDGRITFRRQRPGFGMATIVDNRDFAHLEVYLCAILKLLMRRMLSDMTNAAYKLDLHGARDMLCTAAFTLEEDGPQPAAPFVFTRKEWLTHGNAVIDEFTNARVKHLPVDGRLYELFYFFIPTMVSSRGELPRAVFLTDLETGFLEWNTVVIGKEDWAERLLRELWTYFLEQGSRPEEILLANVNAYRALAADISACGIRPEYTSHSYVGQELLESYLQATHAKNYHLMDDPFPTEPY